MLIDRNSKPWVAICLIIFAAATVFYIPYARHSVNGPHGGSWVGLAYGTVGSAMIVFCILLTPRKKVRTMRVGRAFHWLQGHVWFGLLSYPIILYHAGFAWGGVLTQVLMWIFTIVVLSGVIGIVIQQLLPSRMLRDVPSETIYEQIEHVLVEMRKEAHDLVDAVVQRKEQDAFLVEVVPAGAVATLAPQQATTGATLLETFYKREFEPFLAERLDRRSPLAHADSSSNAFQAIRQALPVELQGTLGELEQIAEERRQLERQRRLHHVLHGWLFIHVPLSFAMIVLAVIHAVVALRFTTIG